MKKLCILLMLCHLVSLRGMDRRFTVTHPDLGKLSVQQYDHPNTAVIYDKNEQEIALVKLQKEHGEEIYRFDIKDSLGIIERHEILARRIARNKKRNIITYEFLQQHSRHPQPGALFDLTITCEQISINSRKSFLKALLTFAFQDSAHCQSVRYNQLKNWPEAFSRAVAEIYHSRIISPSNLTKVLCFSAGLLSMASVIVIGYNLYV